MSISSHQWILEPPAIRFIVVARAIVARAMNFKIMKPCKRRLVEFAEPANQALARLCQY
jgi:hypothetical protein